VVSEVSIARGDPVGSHCRSRPLGRSGGLHGLRIMDPALGLISQHELDTLVDGPELLGREDAGPWQPYINNPITRSLYWKNLLKRSPNRKRLIWRCDVIREIGKAALGCADIPEER